MKYANNPQPDTIPAIPTQQNIYSNSYKSAPKKQEDNYYHILMRKLCLESEVIFLFLRIKGVLIVN